MDRVSYLAMVSGRDRSLRAQAVLAGLTLLEPFHAGATALRNRLFDVGWRRVQRAGRPVISIGNLTTGGTGKTPLVVHVVRRLLEQGACPAVLLRGYRRGPAGEGPARGSDGATLAEGVDSDEAALLRAELPGVMVRAQADRAAGARAVLAARPEVSVFVLDDGFQHRRLHRDLDLVLIDATFPFGNGHQLPRGLLRESPRGLRRADAVIVTRADQVSPAILQRLDAVIQHRHGRPPLAHTAHRWVGWQDQADASHDLPALAQQRVAGLCGIGNPQAFKLSLARHSGAVTGLYEFEDHQEYTAGLLTRTLAHARQAGAQAIVTTSKDWVKIRPVLATLTPGPAPGGLPVYRPVLRMEFLDGEAALEGLLRAAGG